MTVHYLKTHLPCSCCETHMPAAPLVVLPNGKPAIPQHYLQFEQTLLSLQEILQDIETLPQFLLFADEDSGGLYLQVGMIGRENYDRSENLRQQKLVYGRKWRIDSNTPTSEIIQTAYLAVKKAREHEIRELLTLVDLASGKTSAPFSTHQDLPLMANNSELVQPVPRFTGDELTVLQQLLTYCRFGERSIEIVDLLPHKQHFILDLKLGSAPVVRRVEGEMPEFNEMEFSVIVGSLKPEHFLHELMETFIRFSDAFVTENFCYKEFKRFSRDVDPVGIAALSVASRPYARDMENAQFATHFRNLNYQTDASRVPKLGQGALADKNRSAIFSVNKLLGHLPADLMETGLSGVGVIAK